MKTPKTILVRSPNWIGDQILAYPFFHFLRQSFPSARIGVVCVPWVESVQFHNLVNDVICLPKVPSNAIFEKWKALEKGAELLSKMGPWDLGISLPNSFSSAWLLYRSRAKIRRGYQTDGRSFLLNDSVSWNSKWSGHRSDAYIRLLPAPFVPSKSVKEFWGVPSENDLDPDISGVLKVFDPTQAWPHVKPLVPPSQPYWILAPGSAAESRRWPIERFVSLAKKIKNLRAGSGIIVGGPGERVLAAELMQDSSLGLEDWTGLGSVASYWKVFQKAQVSVCNDSGLAHVASLCGSPVQVIWGAGDPKRTEPIGPGKVRIFFNPVECWPCESNFCAQVSEKKLECLKGIHPEAIALEMKSLIISDKNNG